MPILFVHGVNNRTNDCDYWEARGLRQEMFDRLLVMPLRRRFPKFSYLEEVYWGDLGVTFRWDLASVPETKILASLGRNTKEENLELLDLLVDAEVEPGKTFEHLRPLGRTTSGGRFVHAMKDPGRLIRAIFAPAEVHDAPKPIGNKLRKELSDRQREKCLKKGCDRAKVLIAAERVVEDKQVVTALRQLKTDEEVLRSIQTETSKKLESMGETTDRVGAATDLKALGKSSALDSAEKQVAPFIDAAKSLGARVCQMATRGSSLAVLKLARPSRSLKYAVFLGDVFEYLRRGQGQVQALGQIAGRVAEKIETAAKVAAHHSEPLVIVTHSFGSAIVYDVLTTSRFKAGQVDLWAMAGSQVSLFAEIRAFLSSPDDVPNAPDRLSLGRPGAVKLWLNFWDAADVLSYLAEPIFGAGEVVDIAVRKGAHLRNAHSDYFSQPLFYQYVAKQMEALIERGKTVV